DRADLNISRLAESRAAIIARDPGWARGEKQVGVARVRCDHSELTPARRIDRSAKWRDSRAEVRAGGSPGQLAAGDADGALILLRAAYVVRNVTGGRDAIELRGGVGLPGPALAAINGRGRTAIIADDHPARVVRIYP